MSPWSLYAQTGWRRPGPQSICQEPKVLDAIHTYTYDPGWPGFLEYCERRIGNQLERPRLQDCWELFMACYPDEIRIHTSEGERYRKGWLVLGGEWFVQVEPDCKLKLTHARSGKACPGWLETSPEEHLAALRAWHGEEAFRRALEC